MTVLGLCMFHVILLIIHSCNFLACAATTVNNHKETHVLHLSLSFLSVIRIYTDNLSDPEPVSDLHKIKIKNKKNHVLLQVFLI